MGKNSDMNFSCLSVLTAIFLCFGLFIPKAFYAQEGDCFPEWTVQFTTDSAGEGSSLTLVMDTTATDGFDEGVDILCPPDSAYNGPCFVAGGVFLSVSHTPSNGAGAFDFLIHLGADSTETQWSVDLGGVPLDSASLSWTSDTGLVVVNLLDTGDFTLPGNSAGLLITGTLDPYCAIVGCTDLNACNFNADATEDDGSCTFAFFCFDCDGNCLCDEDQDGVCDPFEFPGCTEPEACNYAPVYTEEDGSCYYAQPGYDCSGFCLPVVNDECGLAEPLVCSQVVSATTLCSDTTETEYCDQYNIGGYFHGGMWYTIMGTGDTLRATMCFEDTGYDTYLSVFEGECEDLNCVAGNDDQDEVNFFADPCFDNYLASSVDWESEEGVEYFLHVSGSNAVTPASGGFDFVLVCDGVEVGGCLDSLACNYNPFATFDDGSCDYSLCAGCGLLTACNFDSTAFINDLTLCDFSCYGCTDFGACNFSPNATIESGLCEYSSCAGCLDTTACNFDVEATLDADNCEYTSCVGCTDSEASNYNPGATEEDGSCTFCDLVLSEPQVTQESCFELNDGSAVLVVDSALTDSVLFELSAPGFAQSGLWSDGVFSGLSPGDYLLQVFDGDSTCGAVEVFTVNAAPDPALFLVASSPLCAGGMDGSVSAFVAGNVMASSFLLNGEPADIGGNFLGLSAGVYAVEVNVLVVGGGTCSDTASIVVQDPAGMVITLDDVEGANPGEENGGASVTVTGGEEPYSFVWTGPTGSTGQEDPDDLSAGDWTLEVTDGGGCSTSIVISVPVGVLEWQAPRFTVSPNPTRNAFQIQFSQPFQGWIECTDLTGRRVSHERVESSTVQGTLAGSPSGVYLIRAGDATGGSAIMRLVKQD